MREKRQAKNQARTEAPTVDLALLSAIDESQGACTSCAAPMRSGEVICTRCGLNTLTGEMIETAVETLPEEKPPKPEKEKKQSRWKLTSDEYKPVKEGSAAMHILLGLIGACIGAGLVASVWTGAAVVTGFYIGFLGIAIGFGAGFGAYIGARDHAGVLSGLGAALATVGAFWVSMTVIEGGPPQTPQVVAQSAGIQAKTLDEFAHMVTDNVARVELATRVAAELEASGKKLRWPPYAGRSEPSVLDFPGEVRREVKARWEAMDYDARHEFRKSMFVTEQDVIADMAYDIAFEREYDGQELVWPADVPADTPVGASHFPDGVWDDAKYDWDNMVQEDRETALYTARLVQMGLPVPDQSRASVQEVVVANPMLGMKTMVWCGLAVLAALWKGSGDWDN